VWLSGVNAYPIRNAFDPDLVSQYFEIGRSLVPRLEQLFATRTATVEFLSAWGLFCEATSFLQALYFTHTDDLGQVRAKIKGIEKCSRGKQRIWVAKLLCQRMDAGRRRKEAEKDVAKAIRLMIESGPLPDGFEKAWFVNLLAKLSTYSQKHLPDKKVRELSAEPSDDIPPTDIDR
jgi:hypothetical protein